MTWEDEYRQHEIWANARDALASLGDVAEDQVDNNVLRLRAILSEVTAFADAPQATLTTAHLDHVNVAVGAIKALIPDNVAACFVRSGATQNMPPMGMLAKEVRSWPSTGSVRLNGLGRQAEAVDQALLALVASMESRLAELTDLAAERRREATDELETYKDSLANESQRVSALIDERTTAFRTEHTRVLESLAEVDDTITQQTTRLDTAISSQQEAFAKRQDERTSQWTDLVAKNDAEMREHVAKLEAYEEQSRKVLSAVGVNATATDYGVYANEQAAIANKWRVGAVIAFSIAAVAFLTAAGLSFVGIGADSEWWQVVAQKIGAPAGAAAVGYFLARESGQHRREERRARQVQLTLTALEPFIVNLPVNQQETIRFDTALGIFAMNSDVSSRSSSKTGATGADAPEAATTKS